MTTLIWNNGRLVADTRITFGEKIGSTFVRTNVKDDVVKIFEPKNLVMLGEKILAVSVVGNRDLLEQLRERDQSDKLDMGANEFFNIFDINEFELRSHVIAIGVRRNYTFSFTRSGNNILVEYRVYHPVIPLFAGSGLPHIPCVDASASPELSIAHASMKDSATGGHLTVWTARRGISHRTMPLFCLQQRLWLHKRVSCALDHILGVLKHGFAVKKIRRSLAV